MTQRPTHRVRISRDPEDARWWLARLLDDGPVTQGRTLAEAREMARDMIALWTNTDEGGFDLEFALDLPDDLVRRVGDLTQLRRDLAAQESKARGDLRALAARLVREHGLSMRDAADVLEISHQRVAQLVRDAR
ncbi:MAG: type II toxin-antitoxin system HicB family antitoxin [Egibacteraceae bacterium]